MAYHELSQLLQKHGWIDWEDDRTIRTFLSGVAKELLGAMPEFTGYMTKMQGVQHILGLSVEEPKQKDMSYLFRKGRQWKWVCDEHDWQSNECDCTDRSHKPQPSSSKECLEKKCVDTGKHIRYPYDWKYCPSCGERILDVTKSEVS